MNVDEYPDFEDYEAPLDAITIAGWEAERFAIQASEGLEALSLTDEPPAKYEDEPAIGVVCLLSRMTAGLGVQALWNPEAQAAFLTVTLNGETETFPVPSDQLREAFDHPFAYGATLPL